MDTSKLRTYARVDLSAIIHNINEVRKRIDDSVKVMAVIKADAYGHGAVAVGTALRNSVDYFGIATIEEAVELREAGLTVPMLILGYTVHGQYPLVVQYDVTQTIYTYEDARLLSAEAEKQGKTVKIHLAVDTGMTRIGVCPDRQSVAEIKRICALPGLDVEGIFTHMSCADETDKTYARKQMERFSAFLAMLAEAGITVPIPHICNSAGIMDFEDNRYGMVRAGIVTYGLMPSDEVKRENMDLRPALSWFAKVTHVKTVQPGEGVSYGATFVTEKETRIATVDVGYADGYPRSLSNKGYVVLHGRKAPILGRVCMDQFMIDVSEIPDVKVEDEVLLVGTMDGVCLSMEELGALSGRFNYEFACDIGKRVPRVYE